MTNEFRLDPNAATLRRFDVGMPLRADGVANALRDVYAPRRELPPEFGSLLRQLDRIPGRTITGRD